MAVSTEQARRLSDGGDVQRRDATHYFPEAEGRPASSPLHSSPPRSSSALSVAYISLELACIDRLAPRASGTCLSTMLWPSGLYRPGRAVVISIRLATLLVALAANHGPHLQLVGAMAQARRLLLFFKVRGIPSDPTRSPLVAPQPGDRPAQVAARSRLSCETASDQSV